MVDHTLSKPSKKYSVDEALDVIGNGSFQRYAFLACSMCLMYMLSETLGIGYVIPTAKCDLELNTFRNGILSSVSYLGICLSLQLSGFLTDQYGRKHMITLSVALSVLFSTIAALIPGFWPIVVFRLWSGMSIAACASSTFAYMGEFFPKRLRAIAIMYGSAVASMATAFLMPIMGLVNSRYAWEIKLSDTYTLFGWRIQLLTNTIPGIFSLILLRNLPESPKYLSTVGEKEKCLNVLQTMFTQNYKNDQCPITDLETECDIEHNAKDSKTSLTSFFRSIMHETAMLFKPPHLTVILSCCFFQFGCFLVAGGFSLWYTDIINRISNGDQVKIGICEIFSTIELSSVHPNSTSQLVVAATFCRVVVNDAMYINNIYLGVAHIIGYSGLGLGLNKIPLNTTMSLLIFFCCICAIILQHVTNGILIVVVFCLVITTAGVSQSLICAVVVNLFPTNLRGMAISLSILVGRMGTVVGANSIGFLLDWNCSFTFYIIGLLALACVVFSVMLPKKGSK